MFSISFYCYQLHFIIHKKFCIEVLHIKNILQPIIHHHDILLVDADVAKFLLPDAPCTMLSIPIIKRLTASINVRRTIPNNRFAKTINDTPIDNIPTITRNILDHFEVCLSKIP